MKAYIREICAGLEFPAEAVQVMEEGWDRIDGCSEARTGFAKWTSLYEKDIHMDYKAALEAVDEAAKEAGVHKYTAELLFFLLLTKPLKEAYLKRGIALQIWHDSCKDLYWKLMECKKMYDVWGSFVAWWFSGFFDMTRFALGRLQFELIDFPEGYEKSGRKKPEEMKQVINVHIPSAGKLDMEDCRKSFAQAAAFFADAFPGEKVVFCCRSWMLYPPHADFLKPDSGVVAFMKLFDIYTFEEDDGDLWRILEVDYQGDARELKEDTSMQRAYKKWLLDGNHAGNGEGIFYWEKNAVK